MVLIEALACGLPIVSFDCPYGPASVIEDGVNGYLIEKENISLFADRLSKLMEDKSLREKMGNASFSRSSNFSTKTISEKWQTIFEELN